MQGVALCMVRLFAPGPSRANGGALGGAPGGEHNPGVPMPKRSAHPGVKLIQRRRSSGATWYGRFQHHVTGRWVDVNLTEAGLTTAIERRRWAERKSEELKAAKRARALGRRGADSTRVEDAVKAYMDECEHRLRERTVAAYREALESLQAWLGAHGRAFVQEVSPGDLWAYRSNAIKAPRKKSTISTHLARLQTALDWWRRAELLPLVSSDAIADACRSVGGSKPKINALRPPQVRALLEAAAAHPEPTAAALVALALLTGMRLGEIEGLTWAELDLDAPPGGEIVLGDRTKTHHPRVVDLEVAPIARELLRALPRVGPYVLGGLAPLSREVAKRWKRELQVKADEAAGRPAVRWTWQHLRQTCGTYLTCAPSIFGASSAFRSARQLGHRVAVAEQHYLGVLRGIPADARTLEAAMEAEAQFQALLPAKPAREAS